MGLVRVDGVSWGSGFDPNRGCGVSGGSGGTGFDAG